MNKTIVLIIVILLLVIILLSTYNESFYVNMTEEKCKQWNENKGYIDINGNVFNPTNNRIVLQKVLF